MLTKLASGNGAIAHEYGCMELPCEVFRSAAGFFIGTRVPNGVSFSRESSEYWSNEEDAKSALLSGKWTQRQHP